MNIIGNNIQTFTLIFIDEASVSTLQQRKHIFVPEIVKDPVSIDFTEMLEREWSVEPDEVLFNSKNKLEMQRSRQIVNTVVSFNIQAENGGLVVQRDRGKASKEKMRLPEIETIFQSPCPEEDIDQFLESPWFLICTRFFVILYIIGLLLTDYTYRLDKLQGSHSDQHQQTSIPLSTANIVSYHLQLLANCAFTLEIVLKMLSKKRFFENFWNVGSLIGCLACWGCIFLDYERYDGTAMYHILSILKILLGMRIVQIFQFIKNPFQSFIMTIPQLSKIFFPYLIFITMYAVLGHILFSQANEHKCRATLTPVDNVWPEVSTNLCGSATFQCKVGYCGNPYDYGMGYNETEKYGFGNQFGMVSFENIGSSFLVVYHYVFLSNWSAIMYKFSKFVNPYMTTLYFFTMALFLFFIMSNLNMITMCKTFIEKEKEKQKFVVKQPQPQIEVDNEDFIAGRFKPVYKILQYIDLILIMFSAVVILIQFKGMTHTLISFLNKLDFILTMLCLLIIILKSLIIRKNIFREKFLILDWVAILFSIADMVYCLVQGYEVVDPPLTLNRVLRSIKLIRILRGIYFSKSWFTFEKTILKMFVKTLETVKYFLVLLLCMTSILALIGQNLFAHWMKYDHITHLKDLQHGTSYVVNFDSFYKAIVSVILLLENQRWTETMYNYYNVLGWEAVAYFVIVVFVIHLLLTRLFLAIFLCYFRRNLEKKDQLQEKMGKIMNGGCQCEGQSQGTGAIVQYLQKQSQKASQEAPTQQKQSSQQQDPQKIFWLFRRNLCFLQFLRAVYNSLIFHRIVVALIVLQCLTIVLRTSTDTLEKTRVLNIIQCVSLYFYVFQVGIGVLGLGLYWGNKTYLKESKMNYINIIVVLLVIVSQLDFMDQLQTSLIRRFTTLKILTFFTRTNKETSIVLGSISAISQHFFRMIIIYMFLLILSSLLPLKMAKGMLENCYNYYGGVDGHGVPATAHQCMMAGGDWVPDAQGFTNIFQAVVLMYQIVTSESWTYFIEKFDQDKPWDVFFVLNFFLYNLCLLNIFVGLTVQTYLSLKDEAYKLNLLRPNQRMWLLIRNSINQLIPVPKMMQPVTTSKIRKISYFIISQPIYQNFVDVLAYVNIFVYCLKYYRADPAYLGDLEIVNYVILGVFMLDTAMKLQLHAKYFYLHNSKIELAGFVYHIFYIIYLAAEVDNHEVGQILKFVSALLLILRCKKLLFRFTWSKTLLNSVIEVLPKCVIIGALLAVILFFYISVGMELFKNTKPTAKSDGYVTGFNNAFTSLLTLLKIVSNQSWFEQVAAFVRGSSPIDICYPIHTIQDVQAHPTMGCGSKAGYLYFITFHMIIALLVMNLLIATMVAAYDENYEKEYKSVNIFQLQDCLKLWQKYDPNGTGVIPYKQFWRLSSQIAILFGISKKKLIKGKQKFLEELDIEICQSTDPACTSVLCYKFHDVLTQFSKIKLTVSKNECSENSEYMDFEIHPMIEEEIKDYTTKVPSIYEGIKPYKNFKSGEMKYFFGLLRKMRAWKIVAKKKHSSAISKLSHIINAALKKKKQQQKQITYIRSSISNFMQGSTQ